MRFYFTFSIVLGFYLLGQSQDYQVISCGAGYNKQSYIKLFEGSQKQVANDAWDLAFTAFGYQDAGIFINEYKNGNVAYYINYRNEEGTPTLKKVGMKTKQSNYTIMDAYDRLIEVKHKIATGEELPKVVQRKSKVLFEDIFEEYLKFAKANKKTWRHNDLLVYNKHLSYLAKSDPRTLKPKDFEELKQKKPKTKQKKGVQ